MRAVTSLLMTLCLGACSAEIEVGSVERSAGYGGPCVPGSICANGLSCLFGYCPIVDAGPIGDASVSNADAAGLEPGECGDGVLNAGEACDDGNVDETDSCLNDCRLATCGDGLVRRDLGPRDDGYEICDDGNLVNEDACTNACVVAVCGDGILRADVSEDDRAYEACDDGNIESNDGCIDGCMVATCGDGFVYEGVEACDPGTDGLEALCTEDCQLQGNARLGSGASADQAASSCQVIKVLVPEAADGLYWLDFDGPEGESAVQVQCDMNTEGGGWTRAVMLRRADALWDAWLTRSGDPAAGVLYGLPLRAFAADDQGERLEFFFKIDGVARQILYRGVNYRAWDPVLGNQQFDSEFELKLFENEAYETCAAGLSHANSAWNWSAASGANGCAGYTTTGFIVHGQGREHDRAHQLYGLRGYRAATTFQTIEVFVR